MWQADEKLENPAAEYKNAAGQITAVPASVQELNTGSGTLYVYTAALTGLEPEVPTNTVQATKAAAPAGTNFRPRSLTALKR